MKFSTLHLWLCICSLLTLGGCATLPGNQVPDQVIPMTADRELSDEELLNVSIKIFDPGTLPQGEDARRGLSTEIREAEARFIPIHLKYSMQRTGYWGAVRVVPDDDIGVDLLIRGRVEFSDGESGVISVEAVDARNRVWFRKIYAETAKPHEHEGTIPEEEDAYQDMFNTVANDLVRFRLQLSPYEITEIKRVAQLRYAETMAPESFNGYLGQNNDGLLYPVHLPADDDPMYQRVQSVQARDQMLVDAINGYYDNYYRDLWEPYSNWRKFRRQEVSAMRKLEREALTRQVLGIAAVVGAIAIGASADSETRARTSTLRDVMIMGGAAGIYSGYQKGKESEINKEAIEELGVSFTSEAEPLVMEVEGETVRLTGSAEQQYAKWRQILRTMYMKETGFEPLDPSVSSQPVKAEPVPPSTVKNDG